MKWRGSPRFCFSILYTLIDYAPKFHIFLMDIQIYGQYTKQVHLFGICEWMNKEEDERQMKSGRSSMSTNFYGLKIESILE